MAVGPQKAWSTAASDNATADANVNFAEGQTPASLNNSARAMMAALKGFSNQVLGAKTTGGSANAQTYTSDAVAAISGAYAAGMGFVFVAGYTNTGACTLNVDGVGATAIRKGGANAALAANDIAAGGVYFVVYNGSYWTLLNPESGTVSAQPLDATLTALAALSWSSLTPVVQLTAADTISLTSAPKVTTLELGDASDTTLSRSAAGRLAVEGVDVVLASGAQSIAGVKTLTDNPILENTAPALRIRDSDASSNAKGWEIQNSGGQIQFVTLDDTNTPAAAPFSISRSGFTPLLATFSVPVTGRVAAGATTTGTLTSASANRVIQASGGITIDGNVFTAGDMIAIYAGASSRTLTQGSTGSPTQRLNGTSTTGNLTLAARGMALVYFISATEWVVCGNVS